MIFNSKRFPRTLSFAMKTLGNKWFAATPYTLAVSKAGVCLDHRHLSDPPNQGQHHDN